VLSACFSRHSRMQAQALAAARTVLVQLPKTDSPALPPFLPRPRSSVSSTCRRARIAHIATGRHFQWPFVLREWGTEEKSFPGGDSEKPQNTRDSHTLTAWHGPRRAPTARCPESPMLHLFSGNEVTADTEPSDAHHHQKSSSSTGGAE